MRKRKRAVPIDPVVQLPQPIRSYGEVSDDDDEKKSRDERDLHQQMSNTNTSTKETDSGAIVIAENGVIVIPSTQTKVVEWSERWCDGDKAIPLKKRKSRYEMMIVEKEEENYTKNQDDDDDDDGDYDVVDDSDSMSSDEENEKKRKSKKKPVKKGGVMMEGSRCSRVNGRGWRCMQSTLVGYSLCDHHLGKGRLRSMASVRARSKPATETVSGRELDEKKTKKGRRIGMVKARSLSSLLGQTK